MSNSGFRVQIRVFVAVILMLLGGGGTRHARAAGNGSTREVRAASLSIAVATAPSWQRIDVGHPVPLASETFELRGRAQAASVPAAIATSLRSRERTTGQSARPPPFQS